MSEVAVELEEDSWPDFFPVGVPPKSAVPAEGEFFRLVRSNPPTLHVSSLHMKSIRNGTKSIVGKHFSVSMEHHSFQNLAGLRMQKLNFLQLLVIDSLLVVRSPPFSE